MKRIVFLSTLACAVSGASFAAAQTQELPNQLAPVLTLGGTQAEIDQPPIPPSISEIPDPFDLSGDSSPSDSIRTAPQLTPADSPAGSALPIRDPRSLDVSTRRLSSPSVVDTMANYATLADVPHVGQGPVQWGYGLGQTPNPVAEIMMREYCVDGLWDGYAEQRAKECADQWAHIHGVKQWGFRHHGACQHCGGVKNRYLKGHCDACDR